LRNFVNKTSRYIKIQIHSIYTSHKIGNSCIGFYSRFWNLQQPLKQAKNYVEGIRIGILKNVLMQHTYVCHRFGTTAYFILYGYSFGFEKNCAFS
jgi:hypothetical protein